MKSGLLDGFYKLRKSSISFCASLRHCCMRMCNHDVDGESEELVTHDPLIELFFELTCGRVISKFITNCVINGHKCTV